MKIKRYTPVRQFYAWVGFATILYVVASLILAIPAQAAFFSSTVEYRAKEEPTEQKLLTLEGNISHYTASPDETDDTPTITASNQEVRPGIVANNCLPFGTKVSIDGEMLEVQDRMNRRYGCEHFDVFVETKSEAFTRGRFFTTVTVHKSSNELLEIKSKKPYELGSGKYFTR